MFAHSRNKFISIILFSLLFIFAFNGCVPPNSSIKSTSSNTDSLIVSSSVLNIPDSIPDTLAAKNAMKCYRDVLLNTTLMIQKSYQDNYDEGKIYQPFYLNSLVKQLGIEEDWKPYLSKFTILDMDGDKIPEVVIEIDSDANGWFEVLHEYKGFVYGYYFVYRAMENLKADGTHIGSGGAADNTIFQLSFCGNDLHKIALASSDSTLKTDKNGNPVIQYFIAGKSVSEQNFLSFCNKQDSKESVSWYTFNANTIDKYFKAK